MTGALDQLRLQLLWNRLLAVVEEQAQTLVRTAFSTTVREAGDLSAGVFDAEGRMLAQAVTGTPGHVNAMAASVGAFLRKYPLDRLEEGDVLLTNDPWDGTGHLNDFTVVTPVFREGRPIALFAATSHVADVGGLGFGPDARQVYEEGLLVPIGYLFRRGAPNETLLDIIRANVRDPTAALGDLYSLAGCNDAGARRLLETLDEFGLGDLDAVGRLIIENSARAMRAEIAKLPRGTYENSMRIDGYDSPIDLVCAVTIGADAITVDFAGTSPISPRGVNVPLAYTQAYASFGVRCVVGNDTPNNAGSLSVVQVTAPEGCILNAPRPCAVSARHTVGQMLPDVVLGALAKAIPDRVPAEGASCLYLPVLLGGPGVAGETAGEAFVVNPFYTGGTGARPGKDGLSCTAFPSGVRNTPVEINEATAPILIWRKEYRTDSGGPGRFRGGLGQVMEFAHAERRAMAVSKMFERVRHPARGRDGGGPGAPGAVRLDDGTVLSGMGRDVVPVGRRLVIETPGGGGKGDPTTRARAAAAEDLRAGLISPEAAREIYGFEESDN
ncbi:hydantoinase B/oxoprolinase family protein [Amphiplicatus metriothermophilus]|uniref:N-methylhydantoinase B n=1 Tax=Amphiplicatus metriothermophilus TaxID=1519374 RepID=A0A239PY72_9PROT|nr:hydantoinase B/oxoprolinase family protein [Amphiplicatus metriothermophilus]MBB5519829.1 N-methylhydantoinase B [Amphiplicatus metriothermophilus]SNT75120.1 N-methylhydantoinase B [Amphiplicatus metriothermophilus]